MSKIYFDANCIIYFVERSDELQAKIAALFLYAAENDLSLFCSEIGVTECLYGAFKTKDIDLEATYNKMFYEIGTFGLCAIDAERTKAAAKLGAEKSLKLVDALHFLAAMEFECDVFVTNDERFRSSHGIQVVKLRDL